MEDSEHSQYLLDGFFLTVLLFNQKIFERVINVKESSTSDNETTRSYLVLRIARLRTRSEGLQRRPEPVQSKPVTL